MGNRIFICIKKIYEWSATLTLYKNMSLASNKFLHLSATILSEIKCIDRQLYFLNENNKTY